jgi:parvulin-like peptidyl-prolyl isomerase
MRSVLFSLILVAVIAGQAPATSLDPAAVLAEWNDGSITVGDYVGWWKDIPEGEQDTLDTMEAKRAFLDNMISAELMLAEAESLGITEQPDIKSFLAQRKFGIVSEALLDRAMANAPAPDEEEVDEIYRGHLTQVNVRRIMVDSHDLAAALMDSIAAGLPFEDLAYRHSTDVTGEKGGSMGTLRRSNLDEPWQTQTFRLQAGEVSQPFFTDKGWAIVKVETRTEVPPQDPEGSKAGIRRSIERRLKFTEQAAYLDSLRLAYTAEIYADAVIGLCSKYALALARQGERTVIVDEDVIPDFTGGDGDIVVAAFDGWTFTYEQVANAVLAQPYPVRPILDDPDDMVVFIGRQVKDSLIVVEAEKIGVTDYPEVQKEIAKTYRRRVATKVYRTLTESASVPEEEIRAEYDLHQDNYMLPAGHTASKIVAPSKTVADSFMVRLEAGESFEDIARTRSIDPFTAPNGGRVGFMKEGDDAEFDAYFETMEVGDIRYVRSLEGNVILWLRERHELKPASYEDARITIERQFRGLYRERALADWITAESETRGMKVHTEPLEAISLVP